MPADLSLVSLTLFGLALVLALTLGWIAIYYRLQPVFLLPLAAGLLLGNLPGGDAAAVTAPLLALLRQGLASGLFPALIFLGWGAGANLAPLLAHPRKLVLGLCTPLGFFLALWLGRLTGFTPAQAAGVALIGGGDGLAAVFLTLKLAPELTGMVGLAAFTLVGAQLLLQPHLLRALTSRQERMLRLPPTRKVSRRETLLFACAGLILTLLLAPRAALLTGMFFLGAALKESGVVDRLARTLANRLAEIMAVLAGLTVGSLCPLGQLFSFTFLQILVLGQAALSLATLAVVLVIKVANLFLKQKLNPLLGAAALGLFPDAAHLAQVTCRQEDPQGNIFQHALAINQAAFLTATLTAGLLWGILGGG
jgi:oxaloacetate decarboxylase beta subunit